MLINALVAAAVFLKGAAFVADCVTMYALGPNSKMFGKIASSCPDMTAGKAAGIAQLVMSDANDPEEGGHPSLNFSEYFTCVEGDSMTFDTFLESIDEVDNAEIAA